MMILRYLVWFLSLIVLPVWSGYAATLQTQVKKPQLVQVQLDGLVCSFCANGLNELLSKEKSVSRFEISVGKGHVLIWFKAETETPNEERIRIWVKQSGLKVRSIRTDNCALISAC